MITGVAVVGGVGTRVGPGRYVQLARLTGQMSWQWANTGVFTCEGRFSETRGP